MSELKQTERDNIVQALNNHGCPVCRDCHILEAVDAYILADRRRVLNLLIEYQKFFPSLETDAEYAIDATLKLAGLENVK